MLQLYWYIRIPDGAIIQGYTSKVECPCYIVISILRVFLAFFFIYVPLLPFLLLLVFPFTYSRLRFHSVLFGNCSNQTLFFLSLSPAPYRFFSPSFLSPPPLSPPLLAYLAPISLPFTFIIFFPSIQSPFPSIFSPLPPFLSSVPCSPPRRVSQCLLNLA